MKDRYDDPSLHERTLLPRSYILLKLKSHIKCIMLKEYISRYIYFFNVLKLHDTCGMFAGDLLNACTRVKLCSNGSLCSCLITYHMDLSTLWSKSYLSNSIIAFMNLCQVVPRWVDSHSDSVWCFVLHRQTAGRLATSELSKRCQSSVARADPAF